MALSTFELTIPLTAFWLSVGFDRARRLTTRLVAASNSSATAAPAAIQYRRVHHRRPLPVGWASGLSGSAWPAGASPGSDGWSSSVGLVMAVKRSATHRLCELRAGVVSLACTHYGWTRPLPVGFQT